MVIQKFPEISNKKKKFYFFIQSDQIVAKANC